jgi:hypothetical protein
LEDNLTDAKLLGYYPLILFDGLEMVITQVLPESPLPPLILRKEPKTEKYSQFMGGNINIDNKNENFVLNKTFLTENVPKVSFTVSLQLDILGMLSHLEMNEPIRFNLYELSFINQLGNDSNNAHEMIKMSIDLVYEKIDEVANTDLTLPPWPVGEVQIIINSSFGGNTPSTSSTTFVSTFNENILSKIRNVESPVYEGSCLSCVNYSKIMGVQTLVFSVIIIYFC